jgi:ABC-type transport system involved in multi-copper enzyme maturation permease subunit
VSLKIASGVWLAVGVLFVLGGLAAFSEIANGLADDPIILIMAPLSLLFGVVFVILGRLLKRGRDTRIALTVIGALLLVFAFAFVQILAVLLLVLLVPAIVLQFRPDSGRWLTMSREVRAAR